MKNIKEDGLYPEKWVENYSNEMYKWVLDKVGKKTEAEDLVQETFLAALQSMHTFQQKSSEKTWLFGILKNKMFDFFKKTPEYGSLDVELEASQTAFYSQFFDASGKWHSEKYPTGSLQNNENLLDNPAFNEILLKCIEHLPKKICLIIKLKFQDGIDSIEICKNLGLSSSNLWTSIHRGKLALRDCLEKKWVA
jgi:RNA polymerase sigma-70 factor (ECF subfamily)